MGQHRVLVSCRTSSRSTSPGLHDEHKVARSHLGWKKGGAASDRSDALFTMAPQNAQQVALEQTCAQLTQVVFDLRP